MHRIYRLTIEIVGLQTACGRLLFFLLVSLVIFALPYEALAHLSLWQRIGFDWAPSIGLTRAYWQLLHLNPIAAWHRNWLIYAVIAIGLPLLVRDAHQLIKRK